VTNKLLEILREFPLGVAFGNKQIAHLLSTIKKIETRGADPSKPVQLTCEDSVSKNFREIAIEGRIVNLSNRELLL